MYVFVVFKWKALQILTLARDAKSFPVIMPSDSVSEDSIPGGMPLFAQSYWEL